MRFTEEQIQEARNTDLYEYLLANHESDFIVARDCLRLKDDNSVYIHSGKNYWIDWADRSGGDPIDFLQRFYGYSLKKAVRSLRSSGIGQAKDLTHYQNNEKSDLLVETRKIILPERNFSNRNVFAYLTKTRKIPEDTVLALFEADLLYQDTHNNAVFISYSKDRCELVGTNTYVEAYKSTRCTSKDRFWYFGKTGEEVYITESAIDAISLYELLGRKSAIYASLAGVGNQAIIDRIIDNENFYPILCVDNDNAGECCRLENQWTKALVPPSPYKDWNEMLVAGASLPEEEHDLFDLVKRMN